MAKKIQPVKGTRDFYPEDMTLRNWIWDRWREVSLRAGFLEYDGPVLESLDLYTQKSGDEIVGQLYTLRDRADRDLALRPEMTPTLARMISQRQQTLPRPMKWFCIARLFRYERPQRGRLREFFQWNIDVVGSDDMLADAEVISVAVDSLCAVGLTADDVEVRISSRALLGALLAGAGVPPEQLGDVYAVVDKRSKVPDETLALMFSQLNLPGPTEAFVQELLACPDIQTVEQLGRRIDAPAVREATDDLKRLFDYLDALGKSAFCRFDVGIVRGLAYYTGPVFEVFDRGAELRALCGGGRYDNLMEQVGGAPMSAVGFGLGDVVLAELLQQKGRVPSDSAALAYYVIPIGEECVAPALGIVQRLRDRGLRVDFGAKRGALGKQLKRASALGAAKVLILGADEWRENTITVRDMNAGEQQTVPVDTLLK